LEDTLKKLFAAAVALALIGPASANTITIYDGASVLGTVSDGSAAITFEAFFGSTLATATLNPSSATAFTLGSSSPAAETTALQTILGSTTYSTSANDTTHTGPLVTWTESADYFLLKTGGGVLVAYFYNLSGDDLDLTYTQGAGRTGGRGLSHTADFTSSIAPAVPEPSTWAMMMLGFAGLGFMTYRRRNKGTAITVA